MRKLTSLLALTCLLAACSPDPDPGPPPATTPAATAPSTTPSAAVSNPSTDPLYLEAVEVYRAFFEKLNRAEMSGFEAESLSPAINPHVTGVMRELVESTYQSDRKQGFRPLGKEGARISNIAPNPGTSRDGSIVSIRICTDASHVVMVDKGSGQEIGHGRKTYKEIYFKRFDGRLKGFTQDAKEIEKCPI